MFLTTKGRYAVAAMVEIASIQSKSPIRAQLLAEKLGIDSIYLEKILNSLKTAGIIRSTRGPGGGYSLARNSLEINILDIMNAANEPLKMTKCGSKKDGMCNVRLAGSVCNTHHLWIDLEKQIYSFLQNKTLASVCKQDGLVRHGIRVL